MNEWIAFDRVSPAPVFTARPAWSQAWCEATGGYEPLPMRCKFEDGTWVLVPLLLEKSVLSWRLAIGLPRNEAIVIMDSAGNLADPERCTAALTYLSRHVARDRFTITMWPLCDQASVTIGGREWTDEVSLIDLSDGADAAIERMDGRSRRMAGQALRRGVTCERADGSEAVDTYFDILEDSARRWGREAPSISKRMIEKVMQYGGEDAEIWFARYEGAPIAGGVVVYGASEMYFWTAAMRAEFTQLRPSNALNVALLQNAAARGMRWYNMGSSSGLKGVQDFKDRLGARRVPYRTQYREGIVYQLYTLLHDALAKNRAS